MSSDQKVKDKLNSTSEIRLPFSYLSTKYPNLVIGSSLLTLLSI